MFRRLYEKGKKILIRPENPENQNNKRIEGLIKVIDKEMQELVSQIKDNPLKENVDYINGYSYTYKNSKKFSKVHNLYKTLHNYATVKYAFNLFLNINKGDFKFKLFSLRELLNKFNNKTNLKLEFQLGTLGFRQQIDNGCYSDIIYGKTNRIIDKDFNPLEDNCFEYESTPFLDYKDKYQLELYYKTVNDKKEYHLRFLNKEPNNDTIIQEIPFILDANFFILIEDDEETETKTETETETETETKTDANANASADHTVPALMLGGRKSRKQRRRQQKSRKHRKSRRYHKR